MFLAILDVYGTSTNGSVQQRNFKLLLSNNLKSAQVITLSEVNLIQQCLSNPTVKTVNFTIKNNSIVESGGSFSRLEEKKGVSPRIILAELVSEAHRLLGYVIADKNGGITRVRKDELYKACDSSKQLGVPFVQNGIYRVTNDVPQIASYSDCPFFEYVQKARNKMAEPKVAPHIEQGRQQQTQTRKSTQASSASQTPIQSQSEMKFDKGQSRELSMAVKNGVDPLIISSPKLSSDQMRILWMAKKNNVPSEYFANPKFDEEQMQFFADRIVNQEMFDECKGFISPKYNIDQLNELYAGVCDGVDISEYADPSISAENMYIKRCQLNSDTYSSIYVDSCSDGTRFLKKLGKI